MVSTQHFEAGDTKVSAALFGTTVQLFSLFLSHPTCSQSGVSW
jgi:hypothetical protein